MKKYFDCPCGNETLAIEKFEWDGEPSEYGLCIFRTRRHSGVITKIKKIWRIIKTGDAYWDDMYLTVDEFAKLKAFINDI